MADKILRNRLRVLMAQKGHREGRLLSQRAVAEETGIAKTTVDRYARNEVQRYDTAVVETLLHYFGTTPDKFFEYVSEESGESAPNIKTPLPATA